MLKCPSKFTAILSLQLDVLATLPRRALINRALHWHELLVHEAEQNFIAASETVTSLDNW